MNPDRNFRMRLASPGEIAAIYHYGNVEASADIFRWMAIKQINPGVQIRMGDSGVTTAGTVQRNAGGGSRGTCYAALFEKSQNRHRASRSNRPSMTKNYHHGQDRNRTLSSPNKILTPRRSSRLSPSDKREIEQLDEEEKEFRALRRDLPGVKGSSAAGIVTISVGKAPTKNEFFRTHPDFRPIVPIVNIEVGMEKQYFAVTSDMIEPLKQIGITVSDHMLYLTVTSRGAVRIVPVRTADDDGNQDEYARTKEIGLIQGMQEWVRLYTDLENNATKYFQPRRNASGSRNSPTSSPLKSSSWPFATRAGCSTARSIRFS